MKRGFGCPKSAIWLLADSPPRILLDKCFDEYKPLDWRFPTRHNIWTPIETIMNRELFRLQRARIDDSKFYVRNAVESSETWRDKGRLEADIAEFQRLVEEKEPQPLMIDFRAESLRVCTSVSRGKTRAVIQVLDSGKTVWRVQFEIVSRSREQGNPIATVARSSRSKIREVPQRF